MTLPPDFRRYSAEDFDKLRKTLRAHLAEVLPERDHRDLIMNLIDDVKTAAYEHANALLEARFAEWAGRQVGVYGNPEVPNSWGLSRTGWCDKPLTHRARLFAVEKLEGKDEDESR